MGEGIDPPPSGYLLSEIGIEIIVVIVHLRPTESQLR